MFFGNSDLIAFLNSCIRSCSHLVPCVLLLLTIDGNPTPRVWGECQFTWLWAPFVPTASIISLDADSWLAAGHVLTSYPHKVLLKEFWEIIIVHSLHCYDLIIFMFELPLSCVKWLHKNTLPNSALFPLGIWSCWPI